MAGSTISHLRPPDDLFTRRLRPTPLIGGVQWGATRYAHVRMAPAELPSRPGTLRVELGSLFFEGRGAVRLRHRLLPDPEWRQTGFEAEYQVAPPGRYRLEVSARAGRGEWQPPAFYEFHVAPPFWQSGWTTAPVGCVVISAVWFVARRRTERVAFRRDKAAFLQARQRGQATQRLSHHLRRMLEMQGDGGLLPDLSPWRRSALGQDPRERVGETLAGRYLLEELIGEGGFAAIYRAAELETGHSCAVKILKLEEAEREWILRRFEQEVSALRRLRHPGIVAYHDVGETAEGLPFLVMDHVPGVTLRAALEDGGFPIGRVARLTRQLAQAIASAHAGGVLHRDLKPENLMLVNGGQDDERLVVIDFSIALVKRAGGTMVGQSRAAGSLPYMAPEQLTGFSSPATDVYACALVVFEMLTGRQALAQDWNGADLGGQVEALLRGLRAEVPADAARYLAPALAFDPLARPAEIAAFGERLADLLESS
ncbi:MAG: serine/threonine-protein kinase [Bryobacteraceae bacterium]|nr:serine/threonine-protein kinase [Bryobacteraceae bacterium]